MTPAGNKNRKIPDAKDYLTTQLEAVVLAMGGERIPILVDKPREESWGDYASNVAMVSAKVFKKPPTVIAKEIVEQLDLDNSIIESVNIAGPGFVNFTLTVEYLRNKAAQILQESSSFGSSTEGGNRKVQVEFVSANPTGPLNIVSARAAAIGDVLIRLLKFRGYDARSEYYVNDSGNQVTLLGYSMLARVIELRGEQFEIPDQGYHGKYLIPLAEEALQEVMPDLADLADDEKAQKLGYWAVERMVA
ncbi:hypothetical protein AMJ86_10170, partial [bacterium SM23_57]